MLSDLIKIDDTSKYKLHLACHEGKNRPLDIYGLDRDEWLGWNKWCGRRNDWNRDYIVSFMEYYHIPQAWLFGGVFKVLARYDPAPNTGHGYDIESVEEFEKFEGRLLCVSPETRWRGQGRAFKLETFLHTLEVREIFPVPYDGPAFPGYDMIDASFAELKPVVTRRRKDWEDRLNIVKCVYLITDASTGKYYVGSAYVDGGVWSRLSCYIETGHGWDQGLKELLDKKDAQDKKGYAMDNFKFLILEIFTPHTSESVIKNREQYWKKVLMSLTHGNFNRN